MKDRTNWPAIRDAALIRNPQPNDVIVLEVDGDITAAQGYRMKAALAAELGCKVLVICGGRVATFTESAPFMGSAERLVQMMNEDGKNYHLNPPEKCHGWNSTAVTCHAHTLG